MNEDFDTSEELKAEEELKRLEALINLLPQGHPSRKILEYEMIPWKVKARVWIKKSKPRPIKINDVHRNEQINVVALCAGHQIMMCDKEMKENECYLLVPMKGIITPMGPNRDRKYVRNEYGKQFQKRINSDDMWGETLETFPRIFVAQVYRRPLFSLWIKHSLEFWKQIETEGFFGFWDPEGGPVLWHQDHGFSHPYIPILRVFEIDRDLRDSINQTDVIGKPLLFSEKGIVVNGVPVLTDEEFDLKRQRLLKIFGDPRFHL
jgi:hypothetical protein